MAGTQGSIMSTYITVVPPVIRMSSFTGSVIVDCAVLLEDTLANANEVLKYITKEIQNG